MKVRARLLRTGDGATKVERVERVITVSGDPSAKSRSSAGRDRPAYPGDPDPPRLPGHRHDP